MKVHSVLFLNIPCFGSGTRPWNSAKGAQKMDDGLIEVWCAMQFVFCGASAVNYHYIMAINFNIV